MRLKMRFRCEEGVTLPFNYNHFLAGAITEALQVAGGVESGHWQNMFTFSQLYFDSYDIRAGGIYNMGSSVDWFVSSPLVYFLDNLVTGLKALGQLQMGLIRLPVQSIEVISDPDFCTNMEFSCMSPITVVARPNMQAPRARYGHIEDRDFVEALRRDLVQKYYLLNESMPLDDYLHVEFNQRYITNKKRVSRLINYNGHRILGFMVPFVIDGNPELIKLGYQMGFGNSNHYGFGMVKIWHRSKPQDSVYNKEA